MEGKKYTDAMADFKHNLSDENQIVAEILSRLSTKYNLQTVLDVGCGVWDIAMHALPDHRVIHLDIHDYSNFPILPNHIRTIWDFLQFTPSERVTTLFMCHVMQYIDDKLDQVQDKIDEIKPEYFLLTLDKNNDFLGELARWSLEYIPHANPELSYPWFPEWYEQIEAIDYVGNVSADDREGLLKNIMCVLIDVNYDNLNEDEKINLIEFAKSKLSDPKFTINQTFFVYKKLSWK